MADPNPVTRIVADIIARLEAPEFSPFTIRLSDGTQCEVPSRDHCTVTRLLRRIVIERDDGRVVHVNPLHITSLELGKAA